MPAQCHGDVDERRCREHADARDERPSELVDQRGIGRYGRHRREQHGDAGHHLQQRPRLRFGAREDQVIGRNRMHQELRQGGGGDARRGANCEHQPRCAERRSIERRGNRDGTRQPALRYRPPHAEQPRGEESPCEEFGNPYRRRRKECRRRCQRGREHQACSRIPQGRRGDDCGRRRR